MRRYSDASEEAFRARSLLRQWRDDGDLSEDQYRQLEQETVTDLYTTNIFLRIVLFIFTVAGVAAIVALFFLLFPLAHSGPVTGAWLFMFASLTYWAAEIAAREARFYRHGVEEALAVCSVAFLCIGLDFLLLTRNAAQSHLALSVISAAGVASALWIWHRFGLWYAFVAAMISAIYLPDSWNLSHTAQRCLLCALYAAGLLCMTRIRSRHRLDYLNGEYSLAEAFLWLGMYLVLNLKLTGVSTPSELWTATSRASAYPRPFYWATWVLLWILPTVILARGVRRKDRFILTTGMTTAVLTLVTNKPYLGLPRHTWDPMLLGGALIALAVFVTRWLARGPGGVRYGFTAARMAGKDEQVLNVASSVFGLLTPHSITPTTQPVEPRGPSFNGGSGGASGGAGASGTF